MARIRRRSPLVLAAVVAALLLPADATAHAATPSTDPLPHDFHWGVAVSGYQSEGSAPDSNWRRYVAARTPAIKDPYLNSVDFRHRYAEDIRRAKDMGVNTFRFSVEWARVEPKPGVIDQTELAYYDDLLRTVQAAGMTPMITLDHWVYPGWVADQGAWDNPKTEADWLDHARFVVHRYAGRGVLWITFNEPVYYLVQEAQNRPLTPAQAALMDHALVDTHRKAYDLIHRLDPGSRVTSNVAYLPPPLQQVGDPMFLDLVGDKLDFVGIDYYYGASADNPTALQDPLGRPWDVEPQPDGLYYALRDYQAKFPALPMYVVENGMVTDDGAPRPDGYTRSDHLRDHVYWLQRAKAAGVKVIGYNYWSITDNYEWGSYEPRFGLYTVNVLTDPGLTRIPTDAVDTFRKVITHGGVPAGYVPVRPPALCAPADLVDSCLDRVLPPVG